MFYYKIRDDETHIAEGLLRLKDGFDDAGIPARSGDTTLMLATWNIREFGRSKMGLRGREPLYYIAEILSRFDLVAVQEVREDLALLDTVRDILGSTWSVILTDVTVGTQGNGERLVFLYNTQKVRFGGLAAEVVLPPVRKKGSVYDPANQLARTPYVVGFTAGWFRFMICTVHILYGRSVKDDPRRVEEIAQLAKFLAKMASDEFRWSSNLIVLGDFNIFAPKDVTMEALTKHGFFVPEALQKLPSNATRNKHYDQIGFIAPDMQDHLAECRAGVFDLYRHVYRDEDEATFGAEMGEKYSALDASKRRSYFRNWRTFQMSDHLPMWIELKIDFGREYLERKAGR